MKIKIKILYPLMIIIVIVSCKPKPKTNINDIIKPPDTSSTALSNETSVENPYTVSFLYSKFDEDKKLFNKKLGGKKLLVTGKVWYVSDSTVNGVFPLRIGDLTEDVGLFCMFDESTKSKKLKVGDTIKFIGYYDCQEGILDCVFVLQYCEIKEIITK